MLLLVPLLGRKAGSAPVPLGVRPRLEVSLVDPLANYFMPHLAPNVHNKAQQSVLGVGSRPTRSATRSDNHALIPHGLNPFPVTMPSYPSPGERWPPRLHGPLLGAKTECEGAAQLAANARAQQLQRNGGAGPR